VLDELKRCGVNIPKEHQLIQPGYDPSVYTAALARMRQDGVTSVMCMGVFGTCIVSEKIATNIPYFPEWLSTSFSFLEADLTMKALPQEQRANTFGISQMPKQVIPQLDPWYQAMQEGDPGAPVTLDSGAVGLLRLKYWALLLMASGIQMAGPKLTPQSFADGLWKTKFPNPETPLYEGKVGFDGTSLEMTIDSAEWFASNTGSGPYTDTPAAAGVACYVNHGARTPTGGWKPGPDDVFFTSDCDSGGG
jgi:hypothetical protein